MSLIIDAVTDGNDVLDSLGIHRATKRIPFMSTAHTSVVEVGFTTTEQPGVTPGITVVIGVVPGDDLIRSARIFDPDRNTLWEWTRRIKNEMLPGWIEQVDANCLSSFATLLQKLSTHWDIFTWRLHHNRYYRLHPDEKPF